MLAAEVKHRYPGKDFVSLFSGARVVRPDMFMVHGLVRAFSKAILQECFLAWRVLEILDAASNG